MTSIANRRFGRVMAAALVLTLISASDAAEPNTESVAPLFPPPTEPNGHIVYTPRLQQPESSKEERVVTDRPAPEVAAGPWTIRRVRSLDIAVGVANWDGDVEVDGLVLDVYPLDARGQTIPVTGTLQVELIGRRTGIVQRPRPFVRLGRWTEVLRPGRMGANGARFRLPFQAGQPQWEAGLSSFGLVHVRLNVPGDGVFEASDPTVRIRPYGVPRDRLQENAGSRFFPSEMTGRQS